MDVSFFIASRMRFKGKMAMICIAVSFLVMIIAVAVSSGFRHEIRKGLSSFAGDIRITPVNMNYIGEMSPLPRHPSYLNDIISLPQVEDMTPVVYRAGIIKNSDNIHGVIFKGVDGQGEDSLGTLEASVPSRLASLLSLKEGDEMLSYFVGERVRARKFKVVSVYDAPVEVDDKLIVHVPLADMQRLNGWTEDEVSAFEIHLSPGSKNVQDIEYVSAQVGFITYSHTENSDDEPTVVATSVVGNYPQLFDWLNLIDFNVLFILILMTVVAGFNMISGLLIMLFENISTIGLLKALGMKDWPIAKIFLASSSVIVLKGMVAGNLLALLFCLVQGQTHFMGLDPANYFVSYVPVHIDLGPVLVADALSFIVIMLLLLIPSLFISRVDPAKTLAVK